MSTTPPASDAAPASLAGRMRRPKDDRWLAGVCSGFAREIGVDPLVVRVIVLAMSLFGGVGVLLYVIGVLLIPSEGEQDSIARKAIDGEERPIALGLGLLALIVFAIVSDGWFLGFGWGNGWGFGWLVVAGLGLMWFLRREDRKRERGLTAAVSDPEAPTAVFGETPAPRRRSSGRIALGVTLAGIAIVGAIGAIGGDDVRWDILLASSVIAFGAALVIAAPFGGARALIPLGLLLAASGGVAAAADLQLKGGAGERVHHPLVWSDIKSEYQLAAGRQELDLRDVALPDGTTKVKLEQGFGEMIVRVPDHSRVIVNANVAGGEIEVLGREDNGFDADVDLPPDGNGPIVEIDAHVGFGYIGVVRGDDPVGPHHNRHVGPGAITLGALR
jgi:phage shock protein PspC (stress-responsive transcriptional regulator)